MNVLQMATQTPDGNYWFSPALTPDVKSGVPNEFTANLEPGIRITGRVADEVPRPVKNTLIYVHVSPADLNSQGRLAWSDRRPLREDGTFEFPSLPPGDMQFVVLMEGWTSPLTPGDDGKNHPWSAGLIPQSRSDLVVPMQRTASCEVTVVDDQGKAVPGAAVRTTAFFTPHGNRQQLIMIDGARCDLFFPPTSLEDTFSHKLHLPGDEIDHFTTSITDAQGCVTFHGVPSLAELNHINVVAPGLDPLKVHKPSAIGTVGPIKPGETAKVTVKLEKGEE